jgi:arylsulfatase A-like enzyme
MNRAPLALLAVALLFAACDRASPEPPRPDHILLVSMDTVRADRVRDETAPTLREIAADGVRFSRFYAASSYTIPSHMSIFTGLDPAAHDVHRQQSALAPEIATLAQTLAAAGYRTQAFHEGGYVEARFGFARGFEDYRREPRVAVVREALPEVLAWIRAHAHERWFLFLHTYAAHAPYGGYARYREQAPERGLLSERELASLRRRFPLTEAGVGATVDGLDANTRAECTLYNQLADRQGTLLLGCGGFQPEPEFADSPFFDADLAALRRSYDARIALVDRALGALRATLEDLGLWEDTLLVVTSDHGEAFYEHGLYQHGWVPFDEVLRVPLVISYPRLLAGGAVREVPGLAWHLDLMPTLLALAGVAPAQPLPGMDLSAVIRGETRIPAERGIQPLVMREAHREPRPPRRVVLRGPLKYVQGHAEFGDGGGLLFDLAVDPGERDNLRARRSAVSAEFARLAAEYEAGLTRHPAIDQETGARLAPDAADRDVELSDEERERLRGLGYLR